MNDLYVTQGLTHIQKFHQHYGWGTITDRLLRVTLETSILEVGIGRNLFELDFSKFHALVTDGWIKSLWEFCDKHNITIKDYTTKYPPLMRMNDVYLTEVFAEEGYSDGQLRKLNQCRIYLQVLRLSDIVNGYGDSFSEAYRVQRSPSRKSKYTWPRVPRPGASAIKLWKSALRKTFELKNGKIGYQVREWLYQPSSTWMWFYSPHNQLVYQRFGAIWRVWKRSRSTQQQRERRAFTIRYFNNALSLPANTCRATVTPHSQNKAVFTGWDHHHIAECMEDSNERQHTLPFDNVLVTGNRDHLANQLQDHSLLAVSDGSYIQTSSAGASAWIIETEDQSSSIEGTLITSGEAAVQNSYRSELFGILAILTSINNLCEEYGLTNGCLKLYCDGESALKRIQNSELNVSNKSQHFDVINSILCLLHRLPVQVELHHVVAHQDKYMPYRSLDRPSQLNVMVDSMAKRAVTQAIQSNSERRDYFLPYCKCEIQIQLENNTLTSVSSNLFNTLGNYIQKDVKNASKI